MSAHSAESDAPLAASEAMILVVQEALDEWLFRMHGLISSCPHRTEAIHILAAIDDARMCVTSPERTQS